MIESALLCLALNAYHEARGESIEGQIAVSLVVINRAKHNKTSICTEVYKPYQFSWVYQLPPKPTKKDIKKFKTVARAASVIYDFTGGATHYHAVGIVPKWAAGLQYVGQWGNHYFYKEKK